MLAWATILVCFVPFFAYCSWMAWKRHKFCQFLSKIPGPTAYPLVGNILQFKRDSQEFTEQLESWQKKYGENGITCLWFSVFPMILLSRPDYVEKLLTSSKNITKSPFYDSLGPWLGKGLLLSTGEKWKSRRKLLTPTFHFKILNNFIEIYRRQSATLVDTLKWPMSPLEILLCPTPDDFTCTSMGDGLADLHDQVGKPFDITSPITLCALDIICETAMGVNINAQLESSSDYIQAVIRISNLIEHRINSPWLWSDTLHNLTQSGRDYNTQLGILHGFSNKVINDRINERKGEKQKTSSDNVSISSTNKKRILAFLDLLLDEYEKGNISKEGVQEEVDTFMFEGHDTTTTAMLWTLHLVGANPDVHDKLQNEVDALYDSVDEKGITAEHLKKMHYLECVIKESLRRFPAVYRLARKLSEDTNFGPYQIPKGCDVAVAIKHLGRNPQVWPNPLKFDPERFTLENSKDRDPFAFVPFSAGLRNCIGQKFALMEEKIVLSSIIRNFHIYSTQRTEDIKECGQLLLRSTEGIWVKLTSRRN